MTLSPEGRVCSFCGIVGGAHTKFAGGYGAMICVECVDRCHEMLHLPQAQFSEIQRPPWEQMTRSELLEKFAVTVRTAEQADGFVRDWVALMKERGVPWAQIGRVLGVSRQAAWERFTRPRKGAESGTAAS